MSIDDLEAALREKAAGSSGLKAVVAFDLGEDGTLVVNGRATPAAVSRAGAALDMKPDTTIVISAADFALLLSGALDATRAYGAGRLKVKGDLGPALRLAELFG